MSTTPTTENETIPETQDAPQPQHTALSTDVRSQVAKIESIVEECTLALAGSTDEFAKGLALARGMRLLRGCFTQEIMADVLDLCGSPLGFNSDRPNDKHGPYKPEEIRDAVIQAQLRGARLVGNEFTIISRKAYLNKEYYERKLREIEGFADLDLQVGVPSMASGGGALVPITATWTLRGKPYSLERTLRKLPDGTADDRRIPVRINNGQGADAAVGKGTRKLLAQIHRRLTGSHLSDDGGDPDAEVIVDVLAQEAAGEEQPTAADDAAQQETGGFDYTDFLTEYSSKIEAAVEAQSIVAASKARAWAANQGDLPADVKATVERMHLDATVEIKRNRGENSNRTQARK